MICNGKLLQGGESTFLTSVSAVPSIYMQLYVNRFFVINQLKIAILVDYMEQFTLRLDCMVQPTLGSEISLFAVLLNNPKCLAFAKGN